jgi:hypothetical protein
MVYGVNLLTLQSKVVPPALQEILGRTNRLLSLIRQRPH